MRHLFLAPMGSAFGETLHAIRIARQLIATGDEVVLLAPSSMQAMVDDVPVTFGRIDQALPQLDTQLGGLLRRMKCGSLVLVDAAVVGKVARGLRLATRAFTHPDVPVVAIDCWNLPAQPVTWEYSAQTSEMVDIEFQQIERRLIPVPIAPLEVAGGFCAMPDSAPLATEERDRVRAELGIGAGDRLILWPSATWQSPEIHVDPALARLAAALPGLILPRLARLGPRVHVVHVGPSAFPGAAARYRFLSQVPPRRFEQLVGAADLVIGFNSSATSIATAIAARTPMLIGTTTLRAGAMAEVEQVLGDRLTPAVRSLIADNLPLAPIHAWPLRLDAVLAPLRANNPLEDAIARADVFDEEAWIVRCRELLFDAAIADALRDRQDAYARRVRALPAGHEQLRSLLGA